MALANGPEAIDELGQATGQWEVIRESLLNRQLQGAKLDSASQPSEMAGFAAERTTYVLYAFTEFHDPVKPILARTPVDEDIAT